MPSKQLYSSVKCGRMMRPARERDALIFPDCAAALPSRRRFAALRRMRPGVRRALRGLFPVPPARVLLASRVCAVYHGALSFPRLRRLVKRLRKKSTGIYPKAWRMPSKQLYSSVKCGRMMRPAREPDAPPSCCFAALRRMRPGVRRALRGLFPVPPARVLLASRVCAVYHGALSFPRLRCRTGRTRAALLFLCRSAALRRMRPLKLCACELLPRIFRAG
jgi:hypothetical protein